MKSFVVFFILLITVSLCAFDSNTKIKLNLGLDYSKWDFEDDTAAKEMSHEIDPYLLKTISVKVLNFHGVDIDLYYLTDSLFSGFGFSAPESRGSKDEDGIRRFRFVMETEKNKPTSWGIHADFKKFQGTSVYKAYKNYPTPAINFFPYEGEQGSISVGDSMSWYTTIQEFSVFKRWNSDRSDKFYKIGFYYQSKKAFNAMVLKKDIKNYTTSINGIMELEQSILTLYYTQGFEKTVNKWQFSSELHFGMGLSSYKNQFIETSFVGGSAMNAYFDASVKRDFEVFNKNGFWRLGIRGSAVKYFTFGNDGTSAEIKKDIVYDDSYLGRRTAKKGEEWNLEIDRYETIWGPFFELQVVF